MTAHDDDPAAEQPSAEIVHWMEPKPLRLGLGGASATAAGAFVMGVAAAVALMAVLHLIEPGRKGPLARWR